jgi:phosphoesterase RecJ-like protein
MTINKLLPILEESKSIAVIAHIHPDGDTIGSCLALADMLKKAGKSVTLYCQDTPPANLHFLQGLDEFQQKDSSNSVYDVAIAVDCSDKERMGTCSEVFDSSFQTINIDHHVSNTFYAGINWVDPNAAATGELIYRLSVQWTGQVSRDAAEALYTAINTDTGCFSFSSTTSETYRIAGDLTDSGINIEEINAFLYKSNRVERIRLLARALSSLELIDDGRIAVIFISRKDLLDTGADDSDTENIVNYAKDIIGVELGILLKEADDGGTKASFRSKDIIDVSKLAAQFGGGGHKKAAGATLPLGLQEAKKQIIQTVHSMFKELSQVERHS